MRRVRGLFIINEKDKYFHKYYMNIIREKFINKNNDVLVNIRKKETISEAYAMLFDLVIKFNKNSLLEKIIRRFEEIRQVSLRNNIVCPYHIDLSGKDIVISNMGNSQHSLWCSSMYLKYYTLTFNEKYKKIAEDIFESVLSSKYGKTAYIINWINSPNYPVKNKNNIFSIKMLTNAELFIIFGKEDLLKKQLELVRKMYNLKRGIYFSYYDLEKNIGFSNKSDIVDNFELAEGLLNCYWITKDNFYLDMVKKIVENCGRIVLRDNYILGFLQYYRFLQIFDRKIPKLIRIRYNNIGHKLKKEGVIESFEGFGDNNIFSHIYYLRTLIPKNIVVFGDSHSGIFRRIKNSGYNIICHSISGASLTGLPKRESKLMIKDKIINFINVNSFDKIFLKFGQVDIDLGYYYKRVVKNLNINFDDYIIELIQNYEDFLNTIIDRIDKKKVVIWGINPPTLIKQEDCLKYTERIIFENINDVSEREHYIEKLRNDILSLRERTEISKKFNKELEIFCNRKNILFVDTFKKFLNSDGVINSAFIDKNINDHHIRGIINASEEFKMTTDIFYNEIMKIKE